MRPGIHFIDKTFYVGDLVHQLDAHPELWDDFDLRTNHPQSPHRELSDIFVRYNARANFDGDRQSFNGPHTSVWWPAFSDLPAVRAIVFDLMRHVEGEQLGMVLITKIPAGAQCYPHTDNGSHAEHFDKYAVQLASTEGQAFIVDGLSLAAKPGECYFFDNAKTHHVLNQSNEDRLTMIVCIRTRSTGERSCR